MAEATDEHGEQNAGLEGQGGEQPMEQSYTYEGQPYVATTRRSKLVGFVGAKPSSLASLTTGKRYLSDPLTPLTPRPNVRGKKETFVIVNHLVGFAQCLCKDSLAAKENNVFRVMPEALVKNSIYGISTPSFPECHVEMEIDLHANSGLIHERLSSSTESLPMLSSCGTFF
jgi:hypothetical protein